MDTTFPAVVHPTIVADLKPQRSVPFAEIYGVSLTVARLAAVGFLAMTLVAGALVVVVYQLAVNAKVVTPLLVQIDDSNRPKIVEVATVAQIDTATLKMLLRDFVRLHFARNRATLERDFIRSMYFVDPILWQPHGAELDEQHRQKILQTFTKNFSRENMDVKDLNATLVNLKQSPFQAIVDVELQFSTPGSPAITRTQRANVVLDFTRVTSGVSEIIAVNPLGLQVSHYQVNLADNSN